MSQISAPIPVQQEIQVLPNKDSDGNNYLKVLLLSNKLTRNGWIAPFENVGSLPKEVKESFLYVPWTPKHDYLRYKKLEEELEAAGKSDEEIIKALIEESKNDGLGYVDHIFDDDPNATALYGQIKITDPVENQYINENKRPSHGFSSPGIFGYCKFDDKGNLVYNVDTIRAYQQTGVREPAFPPEEAAIKGVCTNGNSESCKRALAVAGIDSPMENVNNSCGCNKDINMSTNQPTPPTVTTVTTPETTVTIPNATSQSDANNQPTEPLLKGSSNTTQEAIEAAKKEATRILDEDKKKQAEAEKEANKPQKSEAEILKEQELKKVNDDLKTERAEKQEMRNFFLEKMLISNIPRELFKKEEEFTEVKDKTKGFINKYNMGLEDADWLINTVAKGIPRPENEDKKKIGVAGVVTGLYNPDNFLKNNTGTSTVPKSSSSPTELDDSTYPIKF